MSRPPSKHSLRVANDKKISDEAIKRQDERTKKRELRMAAELAVQFRDYVGRGGNHAPLDTTTTDETQIEKKKRLDNQEEIKRAVHAFKVSDDGTPKFAEFVGSLSRKPVSYTPTPNRAALRDVLDRRRILSTVGIQSVENPKLELLSKTEEELIDLQGKLTELTEIKAKIDRNIEGIISQDKLLERKYIDIKKFIEGENKDVKEALIENDASIRIHIKTFHEIKAQLKENKLHLSQAEILQLNATLNQSKENIKSNNALSEVLKEKDAAYPAQVLVAQEEMEMLLVQNKQLLKDRRDLTTNLTAVETQIDLTQQEIIVLEESIKNIRELTQRIPSPVHRAHDAKRKSLNMEHGSTLRKSRLLQSSGGWPSSSHDGDFSDVCGAPGGTFGDGSARAPDDDIMVAAVRRDSREASPVASDPGRSNPYAFRSVSPKSNEEDEFWDLSEVDFNALVPEPPQQRQADVNPKRRSLTPQSVGLAVAATPQQAEGVYTIGNGPPAPPSRH